MTPLAAALLRVWDDVADSVYQMPTLAETVRYARCEISADELDLVRTELTPDYAAVRAATDAEIGAAAAELV